MKLRRGLTLLSRWRDDCRSGWLFCVLSLMLWPRRPYVPVFVWKSFVKRTNSIDHFRYAST